MVALRRRRAPPATPASCCASTARRTARYYYARGIDAVDLRPRRGRPARPRRYADLDTVAPYRAALRSFLRSLVTPMPRDLATTGAVESVVQCAPLSTLSTAFFGPCTARPTRSSPVAPPDGGPVGLVVAGAEQVGVKTASGRCGRARGGAPPSGLLGPSRTRTGWRNIGRYAVPSASSYGSPISSGSGRGDAADQERGDVEPLPGLQVVAEQHGDLGVEAHGAADDRRTAAGPGLVRS